MSEEIANFLRNDPKFLDNSNTYFLCTICSNVMIKACCGPCHCEYCRDCALKYFSFGDNQCPGNTIDCKKILVNYKTDIVACEVLDRKVLQLNVKCSSDGCDYHATVPSVVEHLKVCRHEKTSEDRVKSTSNVRPNVHMNCDLRAAELESRMQSAMETLTTVQSKMKDCETGAALARGMRLQLDEALLALQALAQTREDVESVAHDNMRLRCELGVLSETVKRLAEKPKQVDSRFERLVGAEISVVQPEKSCSQGREKNGVNLRRRNRREREKEGTGDMEQPQHLRGFEDSQIHDILENGIYLERPRPQPDNESSAGKHLQLAPSPETVNNRMDLDHSQRASVEVGLCNAAAQGGGEFTARQQGGACVDISSAEHQEEVRDPVRNGECTVEEERRESVENADKVLGQESGDWVDYDGNIGRVEVGGESGQPPPPSPPAVQYQTSVDLTEMDDIDEDAVCDTREQHATEAVEVADMEVDDAEVPQKTAQSRVQAHQQEDATQAHQTNDDAKSWISLDSDTDNEETPVTTTNGICEPNTSVGGLHDWDFVSDSRQQAGSHDHTPCFFPQIEQMIIPRQFYTSLHKHIPDSHRSPLLHARVQNIPNGLKYGDYHNRSLCLFNLHAGPDGRSVLLHDHIPHFGNLPLRIGVGLGSVCVEVRLADGRVREYPVPGGTTRFFTLASETQAVTVTAETVPTQLFVEQLLPETKLLYPVPSDHQGRVLPAYRELTMFAVKRTSYVRSVRPAASLIDCTVCLVVRTAPDERGQPLPVEIALVDYHMRVCAAFRVCPRARLGIIDQTKTGLRYQDLQHQTDVVDSSNFLSRALLNRLVIGVGVHTSLALMRVPLHILEGVRDMAASRVMRCMPPPGPSASAVLEAQRLMAAYYRHAPIWLDDVPASHIQTLCMQLPNQPARYWPLIEGQYNQPPPPLLSQELAPLRQPWSPLRSSPHSPTEPPPPPPPPPAASQTGSLVDLEPGEITSPGVYLFDEESSQEDEETPDIPATWSNDDANSIPISPSPANNTIQSVPNDAEQAPNNAAIGGNDIDPLPNDADQVEGSVDSLPNIANEVASYVDRETGSKGVLEEVARQPIVKSRRMSSTLDEILADNTILEQRFLEILTELQELDCDTDSDRGHKKASIHRKRPHSTAAPRSTSSHKRARLALQSSIDEELGPEPNIDVDLDTELNIDEELGPEPNVDLNPELDPDIDEDLGQEPITESSFENPQKGLDCDCIDDEIGAEPTFDLVSELDDPPVPPFI